MTHKTKATPAAATGLRLWLWWVLATTAGWVAGGLVGTAVSTSSEVATSGAVVVAGGVVTTGLAQWIVLRGAIEKAVRWVLATVAALPVVAGLVLMVEPLDWGSGVAIGGLVLGFVQWVVLRRHAGRAAWWILASTAGWVLGGLLSGATSPPAGWAVIGVVYGAITGAALMWLVGGTERVRLLGL